MTEAIFISKKEKSVYTTNEIVSKFKSATDLNEIKDFVEKAEDRIFVAWSTVDSVDKSGEKIPVEDVIKDMENYMQMPSINDEHTNGVVGKCLAYKVMIHPVSKTLGILQLNQILKRNKRDDEVWKDLQSGKKTGLSVGGIVEPKPEYEVKTDGSFVKVLTGFQQYETSVVENPCNQYATNHAISTVAKSADLNKVEDTDIYSDKWKSFIEKIKTESSDVNADAICTAILGMESFKSENYIKMVEENKQKLEKTETTVKMDEESQQMEQETKVSLEDVIEMVQALMSRLDEVEAAISGKPEQDGGDEAKEMDEESSEDKEKSMETSKNETKVSLENEIADLKKSYNELKKRFEIKEKIVGERPTNVIKTEKVMTPYEKMVAKRAQVAKRFQ